MFHKAFNCFLKNSVASRCALFVNEQTSIQRTLFTEEKALDLDSEKKRKIISMEMEMERQSGNFFIPDRIDEKYWPELLNLNAPLQRKKFYRYLKKVELGKEKMKRRQARKVCERLDQASKWNVENHIHYGLGHNTLFNKISNKTRSRWYDNNLVHAVSFGQDLVMDLDYEDKMNMKEMKNAIVQLQLAYTAIKYDKDPYHLHFCNAKPGGEMLSKLKLALPQLQRQCPLMVLTEKSYLELFPKERLVYLTPHCNTYLEYNHDDVYIVGGKVDKRIHDPISLAKAKREGLRMAKFPLDKYLEWGQGSKSLTIDQVVKILVTMKNTMNWTKAFDHVPKRKLREKPAYNSDNFYFRNTNAETKEESISKSLKFYKRL